jgi:hypothetical protein
VVAHLGSFGDGDLAVGMKGAVAADRRDHDRAVIRRAEDFGAHVDIADVDEPSRARRKFPKTSRLACKVVSSSTPVAM